MFSPSQVVLLSALVGRDLSREANVLEQTRVALGRALTVEQQQFVSANWDRLDVFLASKTGADAAQGFVQSWREH